MRRLHTFDSKIHLILFLLGMVIWQKSAAQIALAEVPYYGYGEGVGISDKDSLFLLNIRFRIQNRLNYMHGESFMDAESALAATAEIRRLRLRLDGFLFYPELIYVIQLGFSDPDIRSSTSTTPSLIKDAALFYRFSKNFTIGVGKTNLPRNRSNVMSSGDLEFVSRSLLSSTFGLNRDFGFQVYYYNNIGNVYYSLRGALSAGTGEFISEERDGLAYTGRFEILPFGRFTNNGDYFEADLEREDKPKLSVGVSYNHSRAVQRTGNDRRSFLFSPRDLNALLSDFIFKYRGVSLSGEFINRQAPQGSLTTGQNNDTSYVYAGRGRNLQAGFLFGNNYQVAIRNTVTQPRQDLHILVGRVSENTVSFSRYIRGHRFKIQADATHRKERGIGPLEAQRAERWRYRLQLEFGI